MNATIDLPASVLTKSQTKTFGPKPYPSYFKGCMIRATVRYDDQCRNGHNSFSITGEIYVPGRSDIEAGGMLHEDIAKAFPELAPLLKWHLCSSDGPMHYVANTIFQASERDCHGLLAGEFRQHVSRGPNQNGGVAGLPNWVLELPARTERDIYAMEKPAPVTLEWKPYGRTGEGKARELNHARSSAIWPEATDAELIALGDMPREQAEEILLARLPAIMADFKAAVESLGFTY